MQITGLLLLMCNLLHSFHSPLNNNIETKFSIVLYIIYTLQIGGHHGHPPPHKIFWEREGDEELFSQKMPLHKIPESHPPAPSPNLISKYARVREVYMLF